MSATEVCVDLRLIVREELESNPSSDLKVIAKAVINRVSDEELRPVAEMLAYSLVHELASHSRRNLRRDADTERTPDVSRWTGPKGHGAIYLRFLSERVQVAGTGKFRRDCTAADIQILAEQRKTQALGIAREAARELVLLKAMQKAGAATVADLPEAVIVEVVRWQP